MEDGGSKSASGGVPSLPGRGLSPPGNAFSSQPQHAGSLRQIPTMQEWKPFFLFWALTFAISSALRIGHPCSAVPAGSRLCQPRGSQEASGFPLSPSLTQCPPSTTRRKRKLWKFLQIAYFHRRLIKDDPNGIDPLRHVVLTLN